MEIEVLVIEVDAEPIELCKLLKIANLVSGGGEAKMVITDGYVYLNGEVEYQKRKKVYFEDIVQFNDEAIMPMLRETEQLAPAELVEQTKTFNPDEHPSANQDFARPAENKNSNNKAKNNTRTNSGHKSKKNSPKPVNKSKTNSRPENKQPENKQPTSNSRSGRKSISF